MPPDFFEELFDFVSDLVPESELVEELLDELLSLPESDFFDESPLDSDLFDLSASADFLYESLR